MPVRDVLGWLVKRNVKELEHVFEPGPLAKDVIARQDRLERMLEERKRRRDLLQAQVRAMKGKP